MIFQIYKNEIVKKIKERHISWNSAKHKTVNWPNIRFFPYEVWNGFPFLFFIKILFKVYFIMAEQLLKYSFLPKVVHK